MKVELPNNWWRRWDSNPGTIRWIGEHLIWRLTRLCYHGEARKMAAAAGINTEHWHRWVWRGSGCRDAQLAEYGALFPKNWERHYVERETS